MAVNIEVRIDPERQGQAQEAIEYAYSILGSSVADAFAEFGQSAVATRTTLSTVGRTSQMVHQSIASVTWSHDFQPCNCTYCRRRRNPEGWQDAIDCQTQTEEADSLARSLLLSCLSPKQRQEFEFRESITVIAKSGRRYRIERSFNYNIIVLDERDKPIGYLCAGPVEDVPVYDSMLSQKLWLENDEDGFLRVANQNGFIEPPDYFDHPVLGPIRRRQRTP